MAQETDMEYLIRQVDWLVEQEVTRQYVEGHPATSGAQPVRTWMTTDILSNLVNRRLVELRRPREW